MATSAVLRSGLLSSAVPCAASTHSSPAMTIAGASLSEVRSLPTRDREWDPTASNASIIVGTGVDCCLWSMTLFGVHYGLVPIEFKLAKHLYQKHYHSCCQLANGNMWACAQGSHGSILPTSYRPSQSILI